MAGISLDVEPGGRAEGRRWVICRPAVRVGIHGGAFMQRIRRRPRCGRFRLGAATSGRLFQVVCHPVIIGHDADPLEKDTGVPPMISAV